MFENWCPAVLPEALTALSSDLQSSCTPAKLIVRWSSRHPLKYERGFGLWQCHESLKVLHKPCMPWKPCCDEEPKSF